MTTLNLDHTHRLQLIALLDMIDWPGGLAIRRKEQIQGRLDLNQAEKEAIDYGEDVLPNGQSIPRWNGTKSLPPRLYEFSDDDIQRIKRACDNENLRIVPIRDRWFVTLVAQLPYPDESNGQH